ncbi:MAG: glycosyltransferase family 2 protein [Gemmatimonadetes bacterium]|nr:glycosyltransferase family 2 protein [Gemmatimonadota bacterium]
MSQDQEQAARGTPELSVVIPIYNERRNIGPLLEEVKVALEGESYEVIVVDDGSTDGSASELAGLKESFSVLRIISLGRRSGQSAALVAGFDAARGTVLVTMDGDGQNDPGDIPSLLRILREKPDCAGVVGYRKNRVDSNWKRFQSRVANGVRDIITGDSVRDTGCSLKAMRAHHVSRLPRFDGMHRFLPTLLRALRFEVAEVPVSHRPRRYGRSKYGMWGRVFWAVRDAFGVRWLVRRALPKVDAKEN